MPNQGIPPPYLDPSQYPAYLDLQRKQQLAQMLGGMATQGPPTDWNSMRIVPKLSPFSTVAKLAEALGAGYMQKGAFDQQKRYMSGMMGIPPSQTAGPSAPPSAPSAIASQQGPTPVAPLTAQMPPQSGLAAPQPTNQNMLLTGEPRTSQQLLTMMGPQEYAKALAGRYAPTDLEKQIRAAG